MKTVLKLAAGSTVIAIVALWSGSSATSVSAAQGAPAAVAPSASEYKIGVVDIDDVFRQYKKLKTELDTLKNKRDQIEKDLNARYEALQKEDEALKTAPESDREARVDAIQKKKRDYLADVQRMKGELDDEGMKLSSRARQDVVQTIQQIGLDDGYHLILQSGSTVIYFATPINITSKVVDRLNGAPAATAAATPKKSN
ncbi:MAG: OmpH family outer membrane protein [Candidatus Hydrogenedentes bacterium]|nr:OmpH family outer membrane protein [Candidatus Hydrogenedentota bacterium]